MKGGSQEGGGGLSYGTTFYGLIFWGVIFLETIFKGGFSQGRTFIGGYFHSGKFLWVGIFWGAICQGAIFTEPSYMQKRIYNSENGIVFKVSIVLVTCANSRAIYLDLVPDCIANCCVDDLQRCISTCGTHQIMVCTLQTRKYSHFMP